MEIRKYAHYNENEILELYSSVGWTAYTDHPDSLRRGFENSLVILGVYTENDLVGILRAVGDGETITDLVTLETGKSTSKTVFDNMTMPDTAIPGQAMPTIFAYDEGGNVIFSQTISADPEAVRNIIINFPN